MTDTRMLGMGLPPPPPGPPPPGPPPGPPPMWPMMWPPYQPSSTVYVERQHDLQVEAPCKWYEDLQGAGDVVYCRAPAVWIVIAAVGVGSLWAMTRRRG